MIFPLLVLSFGSSFADGSQDLNSTYLSSEDEARLFIGGSKLVHIKDAPYVVALVRNKSGASEQPKPFCTGTIIAAEWVLSAAHCVRKTLPVTLFQVIAGCRAFLRDDIADNCSDWRQTRTPINWKVHPQYVWESEVPNTFDVLLVKVEPFKFGSGVNKIALWAKAWEGDVMEASTGSKEALWAQCKAFGWGQKQPPEVSYNLRTANFSVLHGSGSCACLTDDVTRNLICTLRLSNRSICEGDGGGPLVCQGLLAGFSYIIYTCRTGVLNINRHVDCGGPNVLSAWIFVCPMLSWIHQVVPGVPPPPTTCRSSLTSDSSHWVTGFLASLILLIQLWISI